MSQWRSRFLPPLVGALMVVMVGAATTTASAAQYTYDAPTTTRVGERADVTVVTESPQFTGSPAGSSWAAHKATTASTNSAPCLSGWGETSGVAVVHSSRARTVH
jgi:hypothetical protein